MEGLRQLKIILDALRRMDCRFDTEAKETS